MKAGHLPVPMVFGPLITSNFATQSLSLCDHYVYDDKVT